MKDSNNTQAISVQVWRRSTECALHWTAAGHSESALQCGLPSQGPDCRAAQQKAQKP